MATKPTAETPELTRILATRPPEMRALIHQRLADLRPCVMFDSARVGAAPLRGGFVDRILGRAAPTTFVLSPTASKFGGLPYAERADELQGGRFLGQINFAEVTAALLSSGGAIPEHMPAQGLLAVDLVQPFPVCRVRWYPAPDDGRSVCPTQVDSVARYETRPSFRASWSVRGLEWFDGIDDDELWDAMNDLEVPGVDEDARDGHKLFGHPNEVLNEHYGLTPVAGRSDSIREYALLWRITFDNAAGFAWGTNWVYVIIHKDDLAAGALEKSIVTGANA